MPDCTAQRVIWCWGSNFLCQPCHPFPAFHTQYADYDKRYRQQLSHVEWERCLESLLHLLGVFYEEACREDICETESEEESRAHFLRRFSVEIQSDDEQQRIGYSLLHLPRVSWLHVHLLEHECPWHIGHFSYYLRVHQIAKSYETRRYRRCYGDVVKHRP